MCLLVYACSCLSPYYLQCTRHDFKTDFAKVCTWTRIDFTIGMNVKWTICGESEFFAGTHADLFEATMRALHHFGHDAEHHESADIGDHGVVKNAIIYFCFGSYQETATFA